MFLEKCLKVVVIARLLCYKNSVFLVSSVIEKPKYNKKDKWNKEEQEEYFNWIIYVKHNNKYDYVKRSAGFTNEFQSFVD